VGELGHRVSAPTVRGYRCMRPFNYGVRRREPLWAPRKVHELGSPPAYYTVFTMMRYWFDGVDEGLEREAERSRKLGLPSPDTEPSLCHFFVFVLSVMQAISRLGLAGAFLVWLVD